MRCTAEIISDVKDNIPVDAEELKMALLVLDAINFFNHGHLKRFCQGGLGAEMTRKEFPGACADLGITASELKAMKMDPFDYLTPEHIPGTPEWEKLHKVATALYNKAVNKVLNTSKKEVQ